MAKNKSRKRLKRTDEELVRASLVVQSEVATMGTYAKMLLESHTRLDSPPEERAVSTALLNSLLVATRNLLSFLYSHAAQVDDIIAEDFFDDPTEWTGARPVLPDEACDGKLRHRISKRLAHVTWDRASGTKATWGVLPIVWPVMEAMEAFADAAPKTRLHAQLLEDVASLAAWMRDVRDQYGGDNAPMGPLSTQIKFDEAAYFEGGDPFATDEEE